MSCQGIPHLVILDGDDATLITLSGTQMVAKDQYGLEYPWRARTLINMMPKPLRKILKTQINQAMGVLQGMLEGVAPRKILGWMKVQTITYLGIVQEKIMVLIKEKMSRPVSEGSGNNREEATRKSSQQPQQLIQVDTDMEYNSVGDVASA